MATFPGRPSCYHPAVPPDCFVFRPSASLFTTDYTAFRVSKPNHSFIPLPHFRPTHLARFVSLHECSDDSFLLRPNSLYVNSDTDNRMRLLTQPLFKGILYITVSFPWFVHLMDVHLAMNRRTLYGLKHDIPTYTRTPLLAQSVRTSDTRNDVHCIRVQSKFSQPSGCSASGQ